MSSYTVVTPKSMLTLQEIPLLAQQVWMQRIRKIWKDRTVQKLTSCLWSEEASLLWS